MKNVELAKNAKRENISLSSISGDKILTSFLLKILFIILLTTVVSFLVNGIISRSNHKRLESIENMLGLFDERLSRLEKMGKELTSLDEQRTKLEISLMNRIESLEAIRNLKTLKSDEELNNLHAEASPEKTLETAAKKEPVLKETGKTRYHKVRPGETLYRISLNYGLTVDELKSLNNIGPKSTIFVGQKLRISHD